MVVDQLEANSANIATSLEFFGKYFIFTEAQVGYATNFLLSKVKSLVINI